MVADTLKMAQSMRGVGLPQQADVGAEQIANGYHNDELATKAVCPHVGTTTVGRRVRMCPVRWLHISDIHLRMRDAWSQDVVLKAMCERIGQLRIEGTAADFILLTGDLAYSGKPEEYALAAGFLDALVEASGVPNERIFCIPGNHDIDRDRQKMCFQGTRAYLHDQNRIDAFLSTGGRSGDGAPKAGSLPQLPENALSGARESLDGGWPRLCFPTWPSMVSGWRLSHSIWHGWRKAVSGYYGRPADRGAAGYQHTAACQRGGISAALGHMHGAPHFALAP